MGHIKEPPGVDFTVISTPWTKAERNMLSDIIAHYKKTGKKIASKKTSAKKAGTKS